MALRPTEATGDMVCFIAGSSLATEWYTRPRGLEYLLSTCGVIVNPAPPRVRGYEPVELYWYEDDDIPLLGAGVVG